MPVLPSGFPVPVALQGFQVGEPIGGDSIEDSLVFPVAPLYQCPLDGGSAVGVPPPDDQVDSFSSVYAKHRLQQVGSSSAALFFESSRGNDERVVLVRQGATHGLLLTSNGRV